MVLEEEVAQIAHRESGRIKTTLKKFQPQRQWSHCVDLTGKNSPLRCKRQNPFAARMQRLWRA